MRLDAIIVVVIMAYEEVLDKQKLLDSTFKIFILISSMQLIYTY